MYKRGHHPNSAIGLEKGRGWNKGNHAPRKPHSPERRAKIAAALKGKRKSPEHKAAIGAARVALFDKRGRKPIRSTNRNRAYRVWMQAVEARDGLICRFCGATEDLHHDHIKPWATYPDLRFDPDNGRILCAPCHRKTPTWGVKALRQLQ